MDTMSSREQEAAARISAGAKGSHWRDWRWQLEHSVRDIDTFQRLLGVKFEPDERAKLEETLSKFPLSVTPYYMSLIDPKVFREDPVYMQAFPFPTELTV